MIGPGHVKGHALTSSKQSTIGWPFGPFRLCLPFIHYRFEWPDYCQGLALCAVDLAAIPLMTDLLGMPFAAALAVVIMNGFLYLAHHLLGDPVVPGWITPAIPLLIAYCESYAPGPERVHALIAFQFMLGAVSIGLGATGLARHVVRAVPSALKAGVVMGAGLAAVNTVFADDGRFWSYPITISIAVGLAFALIFSRGFNALKARYAAAAFVGKLGIFPIIGLAIVVAPLAGEAPWPDVRFGFSAPDFATLWAGYTVFGVGLPPVGFFVAALPTVVATYLVVFGDVLQSRALLDEAAAARPDRPIEYSPDRAHLIFGARNATMSIAGPDVAMCGPLWSAMHVVIVERYKEGRAAMGSMIGGAGSFRWGTNTGLLLLPIVSLIQPILGVALALTLLIQGYVSVRVGIMEARNRTDLGIAGVTAAILVTQGAAWAIGVGLVLSILIHGKALARPMPDELFDSHPHASDEDDA